MLDRPLELPHSMRNALWHGEDTSCLSIGERRVVYSLALTEIQSMTRTLREWPRCYVHYGAEIRKYEWLNAALDCYVSLLCENA